jgi:hypothetical protein
MAGSDHGSQRGDEAVDDSQLSQNVLPEGDDQANSANATATQHQGDYEDDEPGVALLRGWRQGRAGKLGYFIPPFLWLNNRETK